MGVGAGEGPVNYIGSKHRLLGEIAARLAHHGLPPRSRILDLFAGTSAVGAWARKAGHRVWANDLQAYAHLRAQALVVATGYPRFEALWAAAPPLARHPGLGPRTGFGPGEAPGPEAWRLRQVLGHLEALPPQAGAFSEAYGEGGAGGRLYFSRAVAQQAQAARDEVEAWAQAGLLSEAEQALLVTALVESLDHLANTASVYGAHLKALKASARAPFALRLPQLLGPPPEGLGPHQASQMEALALVQALAEAGEPFDLVYLDPPYNGRRYDANYHLLETLARWDLGAFEPRGKTGLRPPGPPLAFCSKRQVRQAFAGVLAQVECFAPRVLVSYNDEGLLPEAELKELLVDWAGPGGKTDFHSFGHTRFRADQDHASRQYKANGVREFLFYAEQTQA